MPTSAAKLVRGSVPEVLGRLRGREWPFDLLFADPPYAWQVGTDLLAELALLAAPGAELAVEHSKRNPPPELAPGWVRRDLRRYGESALALYGRTD